MTSNVVSLHLDGAGDPTPITKRATNFPSATLVLAARVDRLAELAIERLTFDPDPHTIVEALADLAQIRTLAGKVMR